jgi:predicted secreted acid phosphatase
LRAGLLALVIAGIAAGSCAASEPRAPADPDAIVAYRDSGEWDSDTDAVIADARQSLDGRLDAGVDRPAMVLDVDDTSLSNYECLKRSDFRASARRRCSRGGRLPGIPQTLELFRHARSRGVTVFFITGRREAVRRITTRNLRATGYAGSSKLLMRPDHQSARRHDGWKARTRRSLVRRGYDVLVNVGDQRSDLDGGYARRGFKLPNPMYVIAEA